MAHSEFTELRRRTIVKSLLWRVVGIFWTWIGVYFIILIVPLTWKNAPIIATLIVIYHHSTRMVMYYFYERIWAAISWGKYDLREGKFHVMSMQGKIIWTFSTLIVMGVMFFLVIYIAPVIKEVGG